MGTKAHSDTELCGLPKTDPNWALESRGQQMRPFFRESETQISVVPLNGKPFSYRSIIHKLRSKSLRLRPMDPKPCIAMWQTKLYVPFGGDMGWFSGFIKHTTYREELGHYLVRFCRGDVLQRILYVSCSLIVSCTFLWVRSIGHIFDSFNYNQCVFLWLCFLFCEL